MGALFTLLVYGINVRRDLSKNGLKDSQQAKSKVLVSYHVG